ncbi:hypothetical protein D3C83_195800 [compost metagenome]
MNVANPSEISGLSEPWFLAFNATVEFHTALTPSDIAAAEPAMTKAVADFGGG